METSEALPTDPPWDESCACCRRSSNEPAGSVKIPHPESRPRRVDDDQPWRETRRDVTEAYRFYPGPARQVGIV